MDINSQHHNLLGNQILPKSEDLVGFKMATIAHQNENGGCCHGNQGAKNVKRKPYSGSF
jgi:hypothetical protein